MKLLTPTTIRKDHGKTGHRFTPGMPRAHVVHMTETPGLPGYVDGGTQPHWTVDPWRRRTYQHQDFTRGARALRPGNGLALNTKSYQTEIIGYCDPDHAARVIRREIISREADQAALLDKVMRHTVDRLNADDDALRYVGQHLIDVARATGVPLRLIPVTFPKSPAGYGTRSRYRLSAAAWLRFTGICGHLHVPAQSHSDPGHLNLARALQLAQGTTPAPTVDPRALRPGDRGRYVAELQARLWGNIGPWHRLELARRQRTTPGAATRDRFVDGRYGPLTTWIVEAVQRRARKLGHYTGAIDGYAGPLTLAALDKL